MRLATALDHNPLPTHDHVYAPGQAEAVQLALKILAGRAEFVRSQVNEIFWMRLRDGAEDDCITSASFPLWPGRIFLSNKALVHIPPNRIFDEPNLHALAENIYHEAIHQHINARVLAGAILTDDFDSSLSPKIEIDWRRDQATRNQFWELDRAYHAACVYSGLIPLRQEFADRGITEYASAIAEGQEALNYLLNRISPHLRYFKAEGRDTLARLVKEPYV